MPKQCVNEVTFFSPKNNSVRNGHEPNNRLRNTVYAIKSSTRYSGTKRAASNHELQINLHTRCQVFNRVNIYTVVFWVMTQSTLEGRHKPSKNTDSFFWAGVKIEVVYSTATLAPTYHSTRCHNPKDGKTNIQGVSK